MIYEIQTYNLDGKTIKVYKERPEIKVIKGEHGASDKFIDEDGHNADICQVTKLVTSKPKNSLSIEDFPIYLPYFADVTEDLIGGCKFEPKTYKNCQLMTETHGGYLQFYDFDSKKVLRIAFNSHGYEPIK